MSPYASSVPSWRPSSGAAAPRRPTGLPPPRSNSPPRSQSPTLAGTPSATESSMERRCRSSGASPSPSTSSCPVSREFFPYPVLSESSVLTAAFAQDRVDSAHRSPAVLDRSRLVLRIHGRHQGVFWHPRGDCDELVGCHGDAHKRGRVRRGPDTENGGW